VGLLIVDTGSGGGIAILSARPEHPTFTIAGGVEGVLLEELDDELDEEEDDELTDDIDTKYQL
jgi:hypothetical protein